MDRGGEAWALISHFHPIPTVSPLLVIRVSDQEPVQRGGGRGGDGSAEGTPATD